MRNYLLDGEETERLYFQKLDPSHLEAWLPFHQDPRSSEFWEGLPKDPKIACQQQFNSLFQRTKNGLGGMNALISKATGNLIGLCGLLLQNVDGIQELEIGYSILPKYWRKGYASEAAQKCKAYAFKYRLATSIISIIHIDNVPSQKVAFKNGMYRDASTTYKGNPVYIYRCNNMIL